MISELQVDVYNLSWCWRHLVNAHEVKTQDWWKVMAAYTAGDDLIYLRAQIT